MVWWLSNLKKSRKPTQPWIRFDREKLNDPKLISAFYATIGGSFADADLDTTVTHHFNKAVTEPEAELLGKQRR